MNHRVQRAALLIDQHRYELAEKELAAVLADEPDNATAHSFRAMCLLNREKYAEAVESAQGAVAMCPDMPFGHYVLSLVWLTRRYIDKAEAHIREAIALAPDDADYRSFLGRILFAQCSWKDALQEADSALAIDPEHIEALNLRAEALRKLGQSGDARQQLLEALRLDPDSSDTHASLGWNYLEKGERKKAEEHFREALRLDPNSEWARMGVVETIRTYNPIYRPIFGFFQWMGSLGGKARWGVIIGAYLGFRLLRGIASANPDLQPWLLPLIVAYIGFALATWIGRPLMDIALRFHPFGRLAISRDERTASTWIGGFFAAGLAALIAALTVSGEFWLWAAFFLIMLIPLSSMFRAERPQPRKGLAIYTFIVGGCGLLSLVIFLVAPEMPKSTTSIPPLRALGGLAFFIFLIGGAAAAWVGNIVHSITWKK